MSRKAKDITFHSITVAASLSTLAIILGIIYVLIRESVESLGKFGFFGFIFTNDWNPVEEVFGAAASLYGTIITTAIALVLAIPIAIGVAVFITEIAPARLKGPISTAIELLAAIPSIVYGMWGLFTLAPIMAEYIEPALQASIGRLPLLGILFEGTPLGIDILTASLILSIMIIPFTASISRDSFNLTPALVKESAYATGATKWEVVKDVIIPYSKMGVFGGIVLSLGRALGETMAVAFVLGNNHQITSSLLDSAATITVALANEFTEADTDIYLSALFNLALILFIMSFIVLALAKAALAYAARRNTQ